jgi:hypothetical protein
VAKLERTGMINLLMAFVLTKLESLNWAKAKQLAVSRYMRTFIVRATDIELSLWLDGCSDKATSPNQPLKALARITESITGVKQVKLHPDLEFKLEQASKGYDSFMARRGVKV